VNNCVVIVSFVACQLFTRSLEWTILWITDFRQDGCKNVSRWA